MIRWITVSLLFFSTVANAASLGVVYTHNGNDFYGFDLKEEAENYCTSGGSQVNYSTALELMVDWSTGEEPPALKALGFNYYQRCKYGPLDDHNLVFKYNDASEMPSQYPQVYTVNDNSGNPTTFHGYEYQSEAEGQCVGGFYFNDDRDLGPLWSGFETEALNRGYAHYDWCQSSGDFYVFANLGSPSGSNTSAACTTYGQAGPVNLSFASSLPAQACHYNQAGDHCSADLVQNTEIEVGGVWSAFYEYNGNSCTPAASEPVDTVCDNITKYIYQDDVDPVPPTTIYEGTCAFYFNGSVGVNETNSCTKYEYIGGDSQDTTITPQVSSFEHCDYTAQPQPVSCPAGVTTGPSGECDHVLNPPSSSWELVLPSDFSSYEYLPEDSNNTWQYSVTSANSSSIVFASNEIKSSVSVSSGDYLTAQEFINFLKGTNAYQDLIANVPTYHTYEFDNTTQQHVTINNNYAAGVNVEISGSRVYLKPRVSYRDISTTYTGEVSLYQNTINSFEAPSDNDSIASIQISTRAAGYVEPTPDPDPDPVEAGPCDPDEQVCPIDIQAQTEALQEAIQGQTDSLIETIEQQGVYDSEERLAQTEAIVAGVASGSQAVIDGLTEDAEGMLGTLDQYETDFNQEYSDLENLQAQTEAQFAQKQNQLIDDSESYLTFFQDRFLVNLPEGDCSGIAFAMDKDGEPVEIMCDDTQIIRDLLGFSLLMLLLIDLYHMMRDKQHLA